MTIAQQPELKGIAKGRAEGIELGEERGMEKGRSKVKREATLEIARVMLQRDLKRQTIMKMTDFSSDDLASIQHQVSADET